MSEVLTSINDEKRQNEIQIIRDRVIKSKEFLRSTEAEEEERDDDVIIVLGNSKGGKSTFINYIIGNTLQAVENDVDFKIRLVLKEGQKGPKIGHRAAAETTLPQKYHSQNPHLNDTIWDTPGFGDNRGAIQDIPNAFYIKSLLTHVKSAKFALVTDFQDLNSDNVKQFVTFLDHVCTIFSDIMQMVESIAIVFTKVGAKFDAKRIARLMNLKLLDCEDLVMLPESREFVEYFVNHPERIGIIYQAEDPDCDVSIWSIGKSLDNNLSDLFQNQIVNIPHETLVNVVRLGLSIESEFFLLETYDELCALPELMTFMQIVEEAYISADATIARESDVGLMVHDENFSSRLDYVISMSKVFANKQVTISDVLHYLCAKFPALMENWESSSIRASLTFIKFLEEILELNKTQAILNDVLKGVVYIETKLQKAILEIRYKRKHLTKAQYDNEIHELDDKGCKLLDDLSHQTAAVELANLELINAKLTAFRRIVQGATGAGSVLTGPIKHVFFRANDAIHSINCDRHFLVRRSQVAGITLGAAICTPIAIAAGVIGMAGGWAAGVAGFFNEDEKSAKQRKADAEESYKKLKVQYNNLMEVKESLKKKIEQNRQEEKLLMAELEKLKNPESFNFGFQFIRTRSVEEQAAIEAKRGELLRKKEERHVMIEDVADKKKQINLIRYQMDSC